VLALKARTELKFGEYLFAKHASVRDVVETMVEGKVVQHPITVPEGLTSEQTVQVLLDSDFLTGNINSIPREGSLLPGTYNESRGMTREQVIQRMQAAQARLLKDIWEHRNPDLPLKTPEQLVILASIIEKETGKPEERTRVAARVRQSAEAEDQAAIGSHDHLRPGFRQGQARSSITKSEKEQPTPYNTYAIDGLPPGPITNPGRGLARSRRQSGAHQGAVLRGRRHRRPHLLPTATTSTRRTSANCRAIEQEAKDSLLRQTCWRRRGQRRRARPARPHAGAQTHPEATARVAAGDAPSARACPRLRKGMLFS